MADQGKRIRDNAKMNAKKVSSKERRMGGQSQYAPKGYLGENEQMGNPFGPKDTGATQNRNAGYQTGAVQEPLGRSTERYSIRDPKSQFQSDLETNASNVFSNIGEGISNFARDEVFTTNPKTSLVDFGTGVGRGALSAAEATGQFLEDEVFTNNPATKVTDVLNRDTRGLGGEAVRFMEGQMPDVATNATDPTTAADVAQYRDVAKYGTPGQAQDELDAAAGTMDTLGVRQDQVGDATKYYDEREKTTAYTNTGDPDFDNTGSVSTVNASGNSALFGNMDDTDIAAANNAYDLYHDQQMKQVAQNDQGLDSVLRYNDAKKEIKSLGKQRARLRHTFASGGMNSRRYAEAMNNIAVRSQMLNQGLGEGPMQQVARQNAASNASTADVNRKRQEEEVRSNKAGSETESAKYVAERQDARADREQKLTLGTLGAVSDMYKGGEYTDEDPMALYERLRAGLEGDLTGRKKGLGE